MRQAVTGSKDEIEQSLAIQDTLMMTAEERLELIANLIVEKIIEDDNSGGDLYAKIVEASL